MGMSYFWAAFIGYLIGSINFGILVSAPRGVDLFSVGSGNPGATNVKRIMGSFWGNTVFILDCAKGFLSVLLTQYLFQLEGVDLNWIAVFSIAGAILGHSFSVFLKFRGGKGVATTMGGLLAFMPLVLAVGVGVWLLLFFCTRVVALASICFALSLPVSVYFFYAAAQIDDIRFILCAVLAVLIIFRHHGNIRRLVEGNESRFSK